MNNLIGTSLDRYRLVSLLGEGGMGAVFKASDITLQRDVAIKILHPQFARRPTFRERFLQEARTAARLRHSSIVKVFDFGQHEANLYIVMEFIPGANLRRMLQDLRKAGQWIVLEEAVVLVQQVALALDYAHKHGVLHRDIKPDNIMLLPEPIEGLPYRPVVTDLGLAKLAAGGLVTQEGVSMGTPAYMSPEQAIGQPTDARSDVYSLGILLYEMVVGRLPFPVRTLSEAIRYHTKEPPPPPRSLRPDLEPSLEGVILKAIAKEPNHRFPNARALAEALIGVVPQARKAGAPPRAEAGAVSLMTRYQESLVVPRQRPAPAGVPGQPPDLEEDRIVLTSQDGESRIVALRAKGLTIGRGADNDLVLAQTAISRHHARVDFDGVNYRIIDLNSTNGTHLDNVRLLPGVPQIWTPDKKLRIGDNWLQLQRAAATRPRPGMPDMSAIDTGYLAPETAVGRIGLFLQAPEITVEAGGSAALQLEALNRGDIVDHVGFIVLGIPEGWVHMPPAELRLMPGSQQQVTIVVQPPKSPESRHGTHPISIRATSRKFAQEIAEVRATLQVQPYHDFALEIHPQRQSSIGHGRFRVRVTSECNTELNLRFSARDPEEGCRYAFEPAELAVPAGAMRHAELQVHPKIESAGKASKGYFFTVTGQPTQEPGLVKEAQGEWVQLPVALSLALEPQKASGIAHGRFAVQVETQGTRAIELSLEATSAGGTCTLLLNPQQLVVQPGRKSVAELTVTPNQGLTALEPQSHAFQVEARPNRAPADARSVQGEWTQTAPALEVELEPKSIASVSEARFQVQLTNRVASDLEVHLAAADPGGPCRLAFAEVRPRIPAEAQRSVGLVVTAEDPPPPEDVLHEFAVVVRPAVAPKLQWRATGEWNRTAEETPAVPAPIQVQPEAEAPQLPAAERAATRPERPAVPRGPRRAWAIVALLLGLVLSFGLFYGFGFLSFTVFDRLQLRMDYDALERLVYVIAGLAALAGLFLTFRVVRRLWKGS